jgi:hypothetical protein
MCRGGRRRRRKKKPVQKIQLVAITNLQAIRFVKTFFIKILNETFKRTQHIIKKKKQSASEISPKNKTGHKMPGNKLPEMSFKFPQTTHRHTYQL